MKKYLVIDFNTTSFIRYTTLTDRTLSSFPYAVQVGVSLYAEDGELLSTIQTDRKLPSPVQVSDGALKFHGIDGKTGSYGADIFGPVNDLVEQCDAIVAHNINFDLPILKAELMRYGFDVYSLDEKEHLCTMILGTQICKLGSEHKGEFKYPKLSELYEHLFGESMSESKSVTCHVEATWKCFQRMREDGRA